MKFLQIRRVQEVNRWAELWEADMQYGPICPMCEHLIGPSPAARLAPLSIKFVDDLPIGDFSWCVPDAFVSAKAKAVLEKYPVKEVEFHPVDLRGLRQMEIWHMNVLARCHMHDDCKVELLDKCNRCGYEDYSTWDGGIRVQACDKAIFRIFEHPGMIFVSNDLRLAMESAGLTNISFQPMEQIVDSTAWMRPRKNK